jgi:signal transduction histidine kinase
LLYYISLKLANKTTNNIKLANKKLREYNYNVAHELKTPLSVIKSDLELLEIL